MAKPTILWNVEQILSFAPDAQVGKAAQGLARPGKWAGLGCNEEAVWGLQKGSGSEPYQVVVDPSSPAFKCSCPSHKKPCKHALGLLFLAQSNLGAFSEAEPPDWVKSWLSNRAAAATRKARAAEKAPVDTEAQARRAARRETRVQQGLEALSLWMEDLVRQGLGNLSGQPAAFWETQAARLVDAQAPGVARRVREMGAIVHSGEGWPARLLDQMGRIYLLIDAFYRLDTLPPEVQEEVRTQIGWSQDQNALAGVDGIQDCWAVVGQRETEEDRLRTRRTWLWSAESNQSALVLDFAAPGQTFEGGVAPGTAIDAELVFWPGPFPQRALFKNRGTARPIAALPGQGGVRAALGAYGTALARNPWLERFLLVVEGIVPVLQGETWWASDGEGARLQLSLTPLEGWRLMGLSGGRPCTLTGEWNGEKLIPLSVWAEGQLTLLRDA